MLLSAQAPRLPRFCHSTEYNRVESDRTKSREKPNPVNHLALLTSQKQAQIFGC